MRAELAEPLAAYFTVHLECGAVQVGGSRIIVSDSFLADGSLLGPPARWWTWRFRGSVWGALAECVAVEFDATLPGPRLRIDLRAPHKPIPSCEEELPRLLFAERLRGGRDVVTCYETRDAVVGRA